MEGREPSQLLVDPNDNVPFPQIKQPPLRGKLPRKIKSLQKSGLNRGNVRTERNLQSVINLRWTRK